MFNTELSSARDYLQKNELKLKEAIIKILEDKLESQKMMLCFVNVLHHLSTPHTYPMNKVFHTQSKLTQQFSTLIDIWPETMYIIFV